jgi:hypothetical protein
MRDMREYEELIEAAAGVREMPRGAVAVPRQVKADKRSQKRSQLRPPSLLEVSSEGYAGVVKRINAKRCLADEMSWMKEGEDGRGRSNDIC